MDEKEMIDDIFDGEDIEDTPDDAGDDTPEHDDSDKQDKPDAEDEPEAEDEDSEKEDEPKKDPEPEAPKAEEDLPELLAERAKSKKAEGDLKRLLDALGYKDVDSYLADKEGISRDEYIERELNAKLLEKAKADAANAKHAKMAADDLAALKAAGLVDTTVSHVSELTNARRFAELREMGLSPIEAYRAAAGSSIDARIEKKAQRAADSKAHLTTQKRRGGFSNGSVMSAHEKAYYREILPDASDAELEAAWKRAKGIK